MSNIDPKRTSHAEALTERYFQVSAGELCIGGLSVSRLAQKHGTPFYVYDRGIIEQRLLALQNALTSRFDIYYSVKANPNQEILKFFVRHGCGLEIASGGELFQALRSGCPAESILFAGPGKRDDELRYALSNSLGEIHVESLAEANRISELSRRLKKKTPIALRINPCSDAQGGAIRMGGKAAPFGIDEEDLDKVLDQLATDPQLDVTGVHLFTGTQILDHNVLARQYRHAIAIARRVAQRLGRPIRTIDFGGGLGIPYFDHERPLDLKAFSRDVAQLIEEIQNDRLLCEARLIVEPGRFLVGEAGVYVARIHEIKSSRGKQFYILDGGMHHHLAASGNLGQTIKRNYPVAIATKLNDRATETVDVVGPLCTPLDILARGATLPRAEVGDLFAVFQSGAYGRSASPLEFLSHVGPPEIWIADGKDHLIRRRGTYEDLIADQKTDP